MSTSYALLDQLC